MHMQYNIADNETGTVHMSMQWLQATGSYIMYVAIANYDEVAVFNISRDPQYAILIDHIISYVSHD